MNKIFPALALLLITASATAGSDDRQAQFEQKLEEARQGNSDAQFDVGSMYQQGRGVRPDRGQAIEWYERSAAQDNGEASASLARMQANEVRFSKELARAEKGDMDSQLNVGNMYMQGIGVNIDVEEAIQRFEDVAEQGHVKAGFMLGEIFYDGTVVEKDRSAAFKWFRSAAEQGYSPAQYYLGKMYASGDGTGKDYRTALDWLGRAAGGGFEQAHADMIEVIEEMNMEAAAKEATPDAEVATSDAKEAMPDAEVATSDTKEATPDTEVATSDTEVATSDTEVATSDTEVATSDTEVATSDAEVAMPDAEVAMPDAEVATPDAEEKRVVKKEAATAEIIVVKAAPTGKTAKKAAPPHSYSIDDLLLTAWDRDEEPVAYLPSMMSTCRAENDRVACYSDEQVRKIDNGDIRFKTKSIIRDFTAAGSFTVTYRNLVISSTRDDGDAADTDESDIGSTGTPAGSHLVKTGWGKPHTLECQMQAPGTISCLKNQLHTFLLVSQQTLASGK